mgnify:CR=1 FL=1
MIRRETKQRRSVLHAVRSRCDHPTADQIFDDVLAVDPHISRGTVYRNLGLMVDAGEIRRIELVGGAACYDRTVAPHAHLICSRCAAVKDLMIEGLTEKLSEMTGETVTDCDLIVYYLCEKCR